VSHKHKKSFGIAPIVASNHIENENEMTEHTDALKILILQLERGGNLGFS
jgi:hypothetical protein